MAFPFLSTLTGMKVPPTMVPPIAPMEKERGFNAPAVRLSIARSSNYISHPLFGDHVIWGPVANGNSVLLHTKNIESDGTPSLASLIIVGVVSTDRPHLGDLGNWKESYNMKLQDVKQQFTLRRPTGFVDFEDDFEVGIRRLRGLQEVIAGKGSMQQWFILEDDTLRFSHRLFEEKLEIPDESSDMEDHELHYIREASVEAIERDRVSKQYLVKDTEMQETINKLLEDYDIVPLEAYDRSNALIPTNNLSRLLKGALVQVTFNLYSNYIAFKKATNFKGQIVQVKVLKNNTHIAFSPRKRGPIQVQMAETSESQAEAVKKFLFPNDNVPQDGSFAVKDEPGTTATYPEERASSKAKSEKHAEDDKSGFKTVTPG